MEDVIVVARAMVVGVAVGAAGTVPWTVLVGQNIKHLSAIPWAVLIMAPYLWLFWMYFVRGSGWPQTTAGVRRASARANVLREDVWGRALVAGLLGLITILLLQGVLARLVTLPRQQELAVSQYPIASVFLWLVMSALVVGVVEETAFRGYLQRPIERRHGPVVAILITGAIFAFAHFTHPEVGLVLLPYYVSAAAVYGSLAYFTDSTFPGMVLHAGGNMFSAFDLFTRGRSEWQLSTTPQPLVWQTGADGAFIGNVLALFVVGAAALWAYAALRRATLQSASPSRSAGSCCKTPRP